jgi:hypothetical protein
VLLFTTAFSGFVVVVVTLSLDVDDDFDEHVPMVTLLLFSLCVNGVFCCTRSEQLFVCRIFV